MFFTSDFYQYCNENDVDIVPFERLPADAATVRYNGHYSVGLNFQKVRTVRKMRTAMMHESGHLHTGALHKAYSLFQIVEQSEFRADADSFRRYLSAGEIKSAMQQGHTTPWQLADYFELDEEYIKKALHYWIACRGVEFSR